MSILFACNALLWCCTPVSLQAVQLAHVWWYPYCYGFRSMISFLHDDGMFCISYMSFGIYTTARTALCFEGYITCCMHLQCVICFVFFVFVSLVSVFCLHDVLFSLASSHTIVLSLFFLFFGFFSFVVPSFIVDVLVLHLFSFVIYCICSICQQYYTSTSRLDATLFIIMFSCTIMFKRRKYNIYISKI